MDLIGFPFLLLVVQENSETTLSLDCSATTVFSPPVLSSHSLALMVIVYALLLYWAVCLHHLQYF